MECVLNMAKEYTDKEKQHEINDIIIHVLDVQNTTIHLQSEHLDVLSKRLNKAEKHIIDLYSKLEVE